MAKENPSWNQVWEIVIQEVQTVISQQQVAQGFASNIRAGGDFAEGHFRSLLRKLLPEAFGVTSGHIVARPDKSKAPIVSPQCDIIVYDKSVVHSLLPFKKKEVEFDFTPIESVAAIFEAKTTLYNGKKPNSLYASCAHLKKIAKSIELCSCDNNKYLTGGLEIKVGKGISFKGGKTANPLIGVLSANTTKNFLETKNRGDYLDKVTDLMIPYKLDIVLSMNGRIIAPSQDGIDFSIDPGRELGRTMLMTQAAEKDNSLKAAQIVARGLCMILMYLQNTVGKQLAPQDYLFF